MIYIGIAIFVTGSLVALMLIGIAYELEDICKAIKGLTNEVNDLKYRM